MEPMRQGQQNRRGRGRNNNGGSSGSHHHSNNNNARKGQNPMTRSFESNGPEVKIRGNPAHIAEKYMAMARDAQTSGDPVLAENYLQHAEHYNRIIFAYREQQVAQGSDPGPNTSASFNGQPGQGGDFEGSEDGEEFSADGQSQVTMRGAEPQPRSFDNPGQQRFDERPPRQHNDQQRPQHSRDQRDRQGQDNRGYNDRGDRRPYQGDRPERFDRGDRPERVDRGSQDRNQDRNQDRGPDRSQDRNLDRNQDRNEPRGERFDRPPVTTPSAPPAPASDVRADAAVPRRRDRPPMPDRGLPDAHEQPEFLRRPVRRPRREEEGAAPAPATTGPDEPSND